LVSHRSSADFRGAQTNDELYDLCSDNGITKLDMGGSVGEGIPYKQSHQHQEVLLMNQRTQRIIGQYDF